MNTEISVMNTNEIKKQENMNKLLFRQSLIRTLNSWSCWLKYPPDFSKPEILLKWISELEQHPQERVSKCIAILDTKMRALELDAVAYFPDLNELLHIDKYDYEKEIKKDISDLSKSFTISSQTTFKDYKEKFNVSDICFFYIKEKFQKFEQLQMYFYDEKFLNKNILDATKEIKKYYALYQKSAEFRQEVLDIQPTIYITREKEPEEILDDRQKLELWNELRNKHMPAVHAKVEKQKIIKEPEQKVVFLEPYKNCDKILTECKKLHQFDSTSSYSYDLDGVIYMDSGKGMWRYLKTTLI